MAGRSRAAAAGNRIGRRVGTFALAIGMVGLFASAREASATPAHFAAGWGFDPAGLGSLPVASIGAATPFRSAGETGTAPDLDVELTGSTALCVLASNSNVCQAANPALTGSISVLVSLTVHVREPSLTGPFTLLLTSLVGGLGYAPVDVAVELSPSVPANLGTSAVPGFDWRGGFTPFVHVLDLSASQTVYDYIGWTVQDGSTVTFRYDLPTGLKGGAYPKLTANAVPLVVPEPGSVLLLALGLAGLAAGGRRRDV